MGNNADWLTQADFKDNFHLIFSAKNKTVYAITFLKLLARLKEISKVISVGVEGEKFSKRRRHDALLVF